MALMSSFAKSLLSIFTQIQIFILKIPIIGDIFDFITLSLSSFVFRTGSGHYVASNLKACNRPEKPLILYEFEFCPFCRKVREAMCVLDLDCIIYPCPRETLSKYGYLSKDSRYRGEAKKIGGKVQFPLLIDSNANPDKPVIMYESNDIIKYLWKTYGKNAKAPPSYNIAQTTGMVTLGLSNLVRSLPEYGLLRIPSRKPEKMLELWDFEASPFAKRVREVLSCLEIPYLKKTAARGSINRKEFKQRFYNNSKLVSKGREKLGLIQVPLLIDPNTNVTMVESKDIVNYLLDTYKIGDMKPEPWSQYGSKERTR